MLGNESARSGSLPLALRIVFLLFNAIQELLHIVPVPKGIAEHVEVRRAASLSETVPGERVVVLIDQLARYR